jgi:hypothetical protein
MLETGVTVKSFDLAWTIRAVEKDSATRFVQGNGGDQICCKEKPDEIDNLVLHPRALSLRDHGAFGRRGHGSR